MKYKLKHLFSLILIMFCVTILCGCAQIDYSRAVYSDGKVSDRIVVEIEEKAFRLFLVSKGELLNLVKVEFENYYIQPIEDFKSEFWATEHTFEDKQLVQDGITTDVKNILAANAPIDIILQIHLFVNTLFHFFCNKKIN